MAGLRYLGQVAVPNMVPNKEAFVRSRFSQRTVIRLLDMMVEGMQKTKFIAMSNNLP